MKSFYVVMALCLGLLCALSLSCPRPGVAQAADYEKLLEKKHADGVTYLSGGIGKGERDYLLQQEQDFNLKLVFALEEGNYLALVDVVIKDQAGRKMVEATSQGPWFYAKVPAGTYNVTATTLQGKPLSKQVQVPEKGMAEARFYYDRKIKQ